MTRVVVVLVALLAALGAARPAAAQSVLTLEEFVRRVAAHHPAVRQARLLVEQAREEQRIAAGGFDPTVSATWEQKRFGTTEYYDYANAALTVPTPLGVDLKLAYERADGRYVSPDRRTPAGGLVTAGLSLPLGQRIVTDERRTALAVARSMREAAGAERDAAVNRVLLQATRDYARWFEAERRAEVAREGVTLAEFRLDAVRRRVAAGEAAALDTVEALLEANRRRVQLVEAAQATFAARVMAEVHLWDARGLPDTLATGTVPSAALPPTPAAPVEGDAALAAWVAAAERAHPDVQRASARVEQAAALRRLAVQQQLPYAAAELGGLADAGAPRVLPSGSADDLKVGLTVRSPLLFLRERGRAGAAGLRVDQQQLERDRVRREVGATVRAAAGDVAAVERAIDGQRAAVELARRLLRGEQQRFEAGESTLFLVNARERAVLDEALRLAGLEARAFTAGAELAAALGWWRPGGADGR